MPLTIPAPVFYPAATGLMRAALFCFARWRTSGKERVPRSGRLIVASNHLSLADPALIGASVRRRITFMAKTELFEKGLTGVAVRSYGAFPVRRFEADMAALRRAVELLEEGGALGMFPEGTRSLDHTLHQPHPGAALLALRTGTPVLPVAIWGTEQIRGFGVLLRRPTINCSIGEPIDLGPAHRARGEEIAVASDRIMRAIAALLPPSYRGVYAENSEQNKHATLTPE